jgi:hypothetical protein
MALGALGSAGKLGSFSQSATSMFSKPAFSSLDLAQHRLQLAGSQQKTYFKEQLVRRHNLKL